MYSATSIEKEEDMGIAVSLRQEEKNSIIANTKHMELIDEYRNLNQRYSEQSPSSTPFGRYVGYVSNL